MKHLLLSLCALYLCISVTQAQEDTLQLSDEEIALMYRTWADSVNQTFTWQHGDVAIHDDLATLHVPEGFKYLDGEQSAYVLNELWGNLPQESLGMLFKESDFPMSEDMGYVVEITWEAEGYVSDDDAEDLDYDDLLETMQEDILLENEQRMQMGYATVDLVGWASAPYYDATSKKLHWAKELAFEGSEENTLNYNIRILGRRGYLTVNGIGDMSDLADFQRDTPAILASMEFNEGHRYEDFDSNMDKVAAVGIGGLIAGKALAKAGILAKLGLILAKGWKFILIGLAAFAGVFKKLFGGGKKEETAS